MSQATRTTNIVIAALGGEGGGTLVSWIEDVAYNAGWHAQATSIAGVAQRTGATIYYIELFPGRTSSDNSVAGSTHAGRTPIMSMFPAPGDIDIAISSEIAEAGRLIQRGFCTKDRTILIASEHHVFGITEKIALHDGRADTAQIAKLAKQQCKQLVSYDMRELAEKNNTVISATLLGALSGSKALPFSKNDYESVIKAGGKMVDNNLAAFRASHNKAIAPALLVEMQKTSPKNKKIIKQELAVESEYILPTATTPTGAKLLARVESTFPTMCHQNIALGIEKLLDYQDASYAHQYLDELQEFLVGNPEPETSTLCNEVARYLALWMAYEDTARVAQIKTRPTRFNKIRAEVLASDSQVMNVNEFFAPRLEELCQPLPAKLARTIIASPFCQKLAKPFTTGKKIRTNTILGFSILRTMTIAKKWRRRQYSYQDEHMQIQNWLSQIKNYAANDPNAALEITECARIIKGYGTTRERGSNQIKTILKTCAVQQLSADQIRYLREAALEDDNNIEFEKAISAL